MQLAVTPQTDERHAIGDNGAKSAQLAIGYRNLMRAVLIQAIRDLTAPRRAKPDRRDHREKFRRDAHAFFRNTRWVREVCEDAGVPANTVIRMYQSGELEKVRFTVKTDQIGD
jgi:hypothetical protein